MRVRYSFSSRRTGHTENISKTRTPVPQIVKDIIKNSDLVIEVLDARFPQETRNLEIEETVKKLDKKLFFVLNKSDLVDINKTEEKTKNKIYPYVFVSCKNRQGIRNLKLRLKIEAKRAKKKISISIIGYPNTGKSSLINVLTGKSSAKTAKEAGYTKGIQKIKLSSNILLLDTPGVIPEDENSAINKADLTKHTKINVRTYDKVKDPEFIVSEFMKTYPGVFEKYYNIQTKGNSETLLEELGRKSHLLQKGNIVDIDRTARKILKDWQDGKIKV